MLLGGGFPPIADLITRIIVLLIAIDIHEFAHAYVAFRMGDTTARDMGRMTLNPFVNINWIGFAMWVLIGFGILGSAPVSEHGMRNRRWGMLAAVAAGPLANLLVAIIASIPFWFGILHPAGFARTDFVPTLDQFFTWLVLWNLLLFIFNLIPLPPLDGWTVLLKLLPADLSYKLAQRTREASYVFFGLIFLSFGSAYLNLPWLNILGLVINPPFRSLAALLLRVPIF